MSTPPSNASNTNIPNPGVPFLDASGRISQVWWAFLLAIFQRTGGGGSPTPTPGITLDDVLSLEQTSAPIVMNESFLPEMIFPPATSGVSDQTFSDGVDFTGGTTTTLTLRSSFASASQLWVFFDGAFQGDDQYSLNGASLVFTSPITLGVSKVYVKGLR